MGRSGPERPDGGENAKRVLRSLRPGETAQLTRSGSIRVCPRLQQLPPRESAVHDVTGFAENCATTVTSPVIVNVHVVDLTQSVPFTDQ